MTRRVKEFIDITDHESLDDLINKLTEVRDSLPGDSEAELRLRGDDVFGRKLSISYFRAQTVEEADRERRYSLDHQPVEASETGTGRRKLRIVA